MDTCRDLEKVVNKVLDSKNQAIRSLWEENKVVALKGRLEGNKSTLILLLESIKYVVILVDMNL